MKLSNPGRKFIAFIICLIALILCMLLKVEASNGICTLFGIYCVGNVGAKYVPKGSNNNE